MRAFLISTTCAALLLTMPSTAEARSPKKAKAKAKPAAAASTPRKKAPATQPAVTKKRPRKRVRLGPFNVITASPRPVLLTIPVARRIYTRPDLELKGEAFRPRR